MLLNLNACTSSCPGGLYETGCKLREVVRESSGSSRVLVVAYSQHSNWEMEVPVPCGDLVRPSVVEGRIHWKPEA